jgi:hypothetical protein
LPLFVLEELVAVALFAFAKDAAHPLGLRFLYTQCGHKVYSLWSMPPGDSTLRGGFFYQHLEYSLFVYRCQV